MRLHDARYVARESVITGIPIGEMGVVRLMRTVVRWTSHRDMQDDDDNMTID